MHIALWILAFVGVALIYVVPFLGTKLNFPTQLNFILKLVGVIIAIFSLVVLYRTGGFN